MIYLTRRVEFSAGHRLVSGRLTPEENERIFGACSRASGHGHNYQVEVTVHGEPDPATGMLLNLSEFKQILQEHVVSQLDHQNLNDAPLLGGLIPTTENLAQVIWQALQPRLPSGLLFEVKVWETQNNSAAYREEA
jgi:6-pyruvoyltetrahydropterin/6-carboxytetrahydropterin synthase